MTRPSKPCTASRRETIVRSAFRLAAALVPRVPLATRYRVAHVAGLVAWRLDGHGRRVATHNLATLLDAPTGGALVARTIRRLYVNHAKNYADGFALGAMSREDIARQTVVFGMDRLSRVLEAGRGAVIATAHLGNVDLGGNGLTARGARCGVLVENVEPAWLLDFFVRNRAKFSPDVIPYREGILPLLISTVKRNVALGITCDWDMLGNGVPVTCAGKTMRMPAGLALIALRARAPIIPIFSTRMRDNRTAIHVEPPLDVELSGKLKDDIGNVSQALAAVLERYLLRYPDQWVLFHPAWERPGGDA